MNVGFQIRLPIILAGLLGILTLSASAALTDPSQKTVPSAKHPSADDKIDINAATLEQLMSVPGMTRTWAARIVRFRPYRAKNDLLDRGVVTSEVYNRIKEHIVAHRAKQ